MTKSHSDTEPAPEPAQEKQRIHGDLAAELERVKADAADWKRRAQAAEQLYARIIAQRNALLAACKLFVTARKKQRFHWYGEAYHKAQAAIAAAESEREAGSGAK